MSRRKISMLEISEVIYHWQKGQNYTHISKSLGISRPTIRKYLNVAREAGLLKEHDPQVTVKVLALIAKAIMPSPTSMGNVQQAIALFEEQIKTWLSEPGMTAKQISCMLKEKNSEFSYTSVNRYIRKIKPKTQSCEKECSAIKKLTIEHLATSTNNDTLAVHEHWLLMLMQGKIKTSDLLQDLGEALHQEDAEALLGSLHQCGLRNRNRALSVLTHLRGIPPHQITRLLMISRHTVENSVNLYRMHGINGLFSTHRNSPKKHEQSTYKESLFAILHSPPRDHGINRSAWTMKDLHRVMCEEGRPINKGSLRKIIRDAGYRFRKAKKVLTSTDPEYQKKLQAISNILSDLSETECFFSIDEFGPFAVKIQGGKALCPNGDHRIVPQFQKSKGSLLLIGALELSTNQFAHFYANRKNTAGMIQLFHILLTKYKDKERLYLSWDAASWHGSREFIKEVKHVNTSEYRLENGTPVVTLAPLPACAQFLNVIESVFSGMARAIIHNSDYESVDECKFCIDRYFRERNEHFTVNPKRAGDKIWGKERVAPVFNSSNNCKDPLY